MAIHITYRKTTILHTFPVSLSQNVIFDRIVPDRKFPANLKQDESRKRAQNMTSRKVHQRRAVYQELLSPESLRQDICMLLLCSYVQNSDFPPVRINPRMKWSFTSMYLLLDGYLDYRRSPLRPRYRQKWLLACHSAPVGGKPKSLL